MRVLDLLLFSLYLCSSSRALQGEVQVKKLSAQTRRVVKDGIRMYFAPLTGALKGIRSELHKASIDSLRHRREEMVRSRSKKDVHHT